MMMSAVSFSCPSTQLYYSCDLISDFCKKVHDLALKIFNAVYDCFRASRRDSSNPISSTITMISNSRNLIAFYRGSEANNNGVTLDQILNWDDGQLEAVHNFIQWLFPLGTPSGPNPTAPVLNPGTIQIFRNDVMLKHQLLRSFRRMLAFYGLQLDDTTHAIARAPNFNARASIWLTPGNHNFLRITRIIHSLGLLGLQEYSRSFLAIMQEIASNEGARIIDATTLGYWRNAVV